MYFENIKEEKWLEYMKQLRSVEFTKKKTSSFKNLMINYYEEIKNKTEVPISIAVGSSKERYIMQYRERFGGELEIEFISSGKIYDYSNLTIRLKQLRNNDISIFKEIVKKFIEYAEENFASKNNAVVINIADSFKEVKEMFSDVNISNVEQVAVRNVFFLIDKSGNCDLTAIRKIEDFVEKFREEFNKKEMSLYAGHDMRPYSRNEFNFELEVNNVPFYIFIKENADGDVRVTAEIAARINGIPKFDVTELIEDGNNLRKVCSEVLIKTLEGFKDEKDKLIIELIKHDVWCQTKLERIKILNAEVYMEIAEVMGMEIIELYVSRDTIDWKKMISVHRIEDVVVFTFSILKEKYYHLIYEGDGCFTEKMLLNREQYEEYWIKRMK